MSSSGPAFSWSVVTPVMPGSCLIFSRNRGAQWLSSPGSESASVYWYWVLFSRPADRDVLRRLHVKSNALDLSEPFLQAQDHLVRAGVTLAFGLQRDIHTPGISRVVAAAGAHASANRGDRRILQHGIDQCLL